MFGSLLWAGKKETFDEVDTLFLTYFKESQYRFNCREVDGVTFCGIRNGIVTIGYLHKGHPHRRRLTNLHIIKLVAAYSFKRFSCSYFLNAANFPFREKHSFNHHFLIFNWMLILRNIGFRALSVASQEIIGQ